jgi:hypothetical protein
MPLLFVDNERQRKNNLPIPLEKDLSTGTCMLPSISVTATIAEVE